MSNLLQQAIRINRELISKATDYRFEIASDEDEEDVLLEGEQPLECLTILRLYERRDN
jgi:hypothetical protein